MAIIYVGPNSAGRADGSSWSNRYGSLTAAEDKPVAAGDVVYVGPGTYRETLIVDVSGSSGSPITYIGDVTGEHTDGIGGIVRITGSDNDQTATRTNGITATSKNYRTFRGFCLDTTSAALISVATSCSSWIIEDCYFAPTASTTGPLTIAGTGTNNIVRRCVFVGGRGAQIIVSHSGTVDNAGHLIENCIIIGSPASGNAGLLITRIGGVTVRNCTLYGTQSGVRVNTALSTGQTTTVNNCMIIGCVTAFQAVTVPATNEEITENYNNLYSNQNDRSNVSTGANSQSYTVLLEAPIMSSGIRYPWNPFALSQFSTLAAKTGSSPASLDLFGITRPATNAKNSWGAIQYQPMLRETTTVHSSSAASLRLSDAGQHQMFVPVTNVSTPY